MIQKFFYKKKVLITGHTGFKGSWLSLWMYKMGAKACGISNKTITTPSNFKILGLKKKILSKIIDIRNYKSLNEQVLSFEPDYLFHLAAEAIVKRSFQNQKYAWETNTLGTINILEILKNYKKKITVVMITSDKVYKNREINRGYKENDTLGDLDPYSSSKASADLAIQSYIKSFLKQKTNIKIVIARAGNVIGGGDWSEGRLIPDCIKNWSSNKTVLIRNPNSTRPWQHVLDVLYGYILLSVRLKKNKKLNGHVFNFGPKAKKNNQVIKIVELMNIHWQKAKWTISKKNKTFQESKLLQLNSLKAKRYINWSCFLNLNKTVSYTILWYKFYLENPKKIFDFSLKQIDNFLNLTKKSN